MKFLTFNNDLMNRFMRRVIKDLLRACPHHGFTELHKLDTFYNALNPADQDSLNSATPPAFVKAVEEIYITCGGAHPYYQCLATDGNTFLEFWDNIQGYVSTAAVNYNQEYLLNHDPTKEMDSILEDSIDEDNLADPNDNLFYTMPEMFTDEHTLDYSSPPIYDDFDDDLVESESDNEYAYNDLFDSKEDKIKETKLLIDELDPLRSSGFFPPLEYDS
nr:reverse transcriptase domain-containing protein [Tanacetum cinerariifolium]